MSHIATMNLIPMLPLELVDLIINRYANHDASLQTADDVVGQTYPAFLDYQVVAMFGVSSIYAEVLAVVIGLDQGAVDNDTSSFGFAPQLLEKHAYTFLDDHKYLILPSQKQWVDFDFEFEFDL